MFLQVMSAAYTEEQLDGGDSRVVLRLPAALAPVKDELSVKAANGTMTEDDRATIQDEVTQLKEEITRISDTTEFNGQKLLNGEFDLKAAFPRMQSMQNPLLHSWDLLSPPMSLNGSVSSHRTCSGGRGRLPVAA